MLQMHPPVIIEDLKPTPLANLFWEEGMSHIRQLPNKESTKDFRIQHTLAKYLGMAELKGLRLQNKFCRTWVMNCPYFVRHGKISDSWYKQTAGCNTDRPILWTKFHITHFAFRRLSIDFPKYIFETAMNIKDLTLSHSTLGSLALSYILNSCRNMESLKLDAVRFRNVDHVSDYDKSLLLEHTLPKSDTDDTAHINEALRMRKAFQNLTITNTFIMEVISSVLLMDRSQYLQNIYIVKCLKDDTQSYDPTKGINKGISFHQRGITFMTCVKDILTANLNSITRLVIDDCNIHDEALEIFAPVFRQLLLKHLELTITQSSISTAEVILTKLFTPECNWSILEEFSLDFYGNISAKHITDILSASVNTLKIFKLTTHTNNPLQEICLKSHLSEMKVLETVYIKDAKEIVAKDLKDSRNLHSQNQKQALKNHKVINLSHCGLQRSLIHSDFCTEFLLHLPSTTKELSLCGIIRDKNFQETLETLKNTTETFLNLTSLEIRGPCLSAYALNLGKLIFQITKLHSLTLSDCELTDAHLTGLSYESAKIMRKCGTYMLAYNNYMDASNNTANPYTQKNIDILKNVTLPGCNISKLENGFRFAEMTELKNLDLSLNHGVSDITIFYLLQIPHLKRLSLESCPKITDSGLEFIPSYLPNLEALNLRNCRLLSKHGLNRLVRFCPKIKQILTTKVIQNNDYDIDVSQLSSHFDAVVRSS